MGVVSVQSPGNRYTMASKLLEIWQSFAQGDESYINGKTYVAILTTLGELAQ